MAPLSVLLALMLAQAHPGTSIISSGGPQDKQALRQDKDSQSRRIGVGLAVIPGPAPDESKESRAQAEQNKRGAQLSGQASHIHGTVYGGEGFGHGGAGGFDGYAGHHGGSGLGFYGAGGGTGGFGGDLGGGGLGGGLDGGFGGGHIDYGHHHDSHYHKALAVKSLLVPLAGVALLGAAAAFVTNPILLQLGVISGKRRRRAAVPAASAEDQEQVQRMAQLARQRVGDLQLLENFMSQIPRAEARAQEQRLLASYLTCTGIVPTSPPPASASASNDSSANALLGAGLGLGLGSSASCLERLSCELHQEEADGSGSGSGTGALERHVMRVVTGEILSNEFIPESVKTSVEKAVRRGKAGDDCSKYYPCQDLDDKSD